MTYIIDNWKIIDKELGKASVLQLMIKEFSSKVHLIISKEDKTSSCGIWEVEFAVEVYLRQNPKGKFAVGFVKLEKGLLICIHLGLKVMYIGIRDTDIMFWKLSQIEGTWLFWLYTRTGVEVRHTPIYFYVKSQNISKVRRYFKKYGYPEDK